MYAFLIQFVDFLRTHQIHYFLIFFIFIWLRWFVVYTKALRYLPYNQPYATTTSVIIPVVSEPADVFTEVLLSISAQSPSQIIVVINGPRNQELERVCDNFALVERHWTKKPGKRNAIRLGMKYATGDVIALVDSDTIWTKDTLKELVKPFADPSVGGVTTRQKITNPTANLISRLCDWLEDVRAYGTMQAMSVNGKVGCLPGRTIAFRRHILKKVMPNFIKQRFLGLHKEVSDDRVLTNLTLKAGYKTVMQATSVVYTEAPSTWRVFLRQQLRWSEGSQYNNIQMTPWMFRNAKLMLFIYWSDMLMPFFLWGIYLSYIARLTFGLESQYDLLFLGDWPPALLVLATFAGAYLSYAIRQLRVLEESPRHLLYLPLYILVLTFVLAPIRMIGFARLADDMGWGTRANSYKAKKASLKVRFTNAFTS